MSKPKAVLISDIHFNVQNLELATKALMAAYTKAVTLDVPLIIAGDTNDTKAILRGEVVNRLCGILSGAVVPIYMLVGNHDLLNEKGKEHSLNFLRPYASIIQSPIYLNPTNIYLMPYYSDHDEFLRELTQIPNGSTIIAHQGVLGAYMGDYVQDKSSIDPELLTEYRIFSGHYHRHQTLGTVTYIGNPYTMSFGEANDGPKGYLILNDDNTFEQVPLNLRKHIVITRTIETMSQKLPSFCDNDLIWLKVTGLLSQLNELNKREIENTLFNGMSIRLDLIPLEEDQVIPVSNLLSGDTLYDHYIDQLADTDDHKAYLKQLWRKL